MTQIPRDKNLDSTLALLSDGYTFVSKRCQRYQSDIFETRLMLRSVRQPSVNGWKVTTMATPYGIYVAVVLLWIVGLV